MNGTFNCKECRKEIKLTDKEIKSYKLRTWKMPVRCKECRELRRDFFRAYKLIKSIVRKLSIRDREAINKLRKLLE